MIVQSSSVQYLGFDADVDGDSAAAALQAQISHNTIQGLRLITVLPFRDGFVVVSVDPKTPLKMPEETRVELNQVALLAQKEDDQDAILDQAREETSPNLDVKPSRQLIRRIERERNRGK